MPEKQGTLRGVIQHKDFGSLTRERQHGLVQRLAPNAEGLSPEALDSIITRLSAGPEPTGFLQTIGPAGEELAASGISMQETGQRLQQEARETPYNFWTREGAWKEPAGKALEGLGVATEFISPVAGPVWAASENVVKFGVSKWLSPEDRDRASITGIGAIDDQIWKAIRTPEQHAAARELVKRNADNLWNLSGTQRPTTGNPVVDLIVDIVTPSVPFAKMGKLLLPLLNIRSKSGLIRATAELFSPKAASVISRALKTLPEEFTRGEAHKLLTPGLVPEGATFLKKKGKPHESPLGVTPSVPGGIPPRKIQTITGETRWNLLRKKHKDDPEMLDKIDAAESKSLGFTEVPRRVKEEVAELPVVEVGKAVESGAPGLRGEKAAKALLEQQALFPGTGPTGLIAKPYPEKLVPAHILKGTNVAKQFQVRNVQKATTPKVPKPKPTKTPAPIGTTATPPQETVTYLGFRGIDPVAAERLKMKALEVSEQALEAIKKIEGTSKVARRAPRLAKALSDEIDNTRAEILLDEKYNTDSAEAAVKAGSRDPQLIPEAVKPRGLGIPVPVPKQELDKRGISRILQVGRKYFPGFTEEDLARHSRHLFGEGRVEPRTKHESQRMVSFLREESKYEQLYPINLTDNSYRYENPGRLAGPAGGKLKEGIKKIDRAFVTSSLTGMRQQGPEGSEIADRVKRAWNVGEVKAGEAIHVIDEIDRSMKGPHRKAMIKNLYEYQNGLTTKILFPEVRIASNRIDEINRGIFAQAAHLGMSVLHKSGKKVLYSEMPNVRFYPHVIKADVLKKRVEEAVKHVSDNDPYLTPALARKLVENQYVEYTTKRFGNLESARELNLPDWAYVTEPFEALKYYYDKAFLRIEEVRNYGENDEILYDLIEQASTRKGTKGEANEAYMRSTVDQMTLRPPPGGEFRDFAEGLRGAQVLTKMGVFSSLINMSQPIVTLSIRTDTRAMVKGLVALGKGYGNQVILGGRNKARDIAVQSGAVTTGASKALVEMVGGSGSVATGYLRVTGFSATERINRIWAVEAGRNFADRMAREIIESPNDKNIRFQLARLGIDPDTVIKEGGFLSERQRNIAGLEISNATQFRGRPQDLPPMWTKSPEWRTLFQFKTFSYSQARLVNEEVIHEAARDPVRFAKNLTKLLTIFPIAGAFFQRGKLPTEVFLGEDIDTPYPGREGIREGLNSFMREKWDLPPEFIDEIEFTSPDENVQKAIEGLGPPFDDPELSRIAAKVIEDIATVGAMGLFFDTWRSIQYGETALLKQALGPGAAQISDVGFTAGAGLFELLTGDYDELVKRLLGFSQRNIPGGFGPILRGPGAEPERKRRRGRPSR